VGTTNGAGWARWKGGKAMKRRMKEEEEVVV